LYTSGTTGASKGATLTHGNLHAALDAALRLNPALARGAVLHMLPLAHCFGLLMLNLSHAWGCTPVLLQQFDRRRCFH
jgi:long-subunit acyl-CoA synthetase (AMP-forming)